MTTETSSYQNTRLQNEIRALYQNVLTRGEFPQDTMLWPVYQNRMSPNDFKDYVGKIVEKLKERFQVKMGTFEDGAVVLLSIKLRESVNG